MNLSLITIQAVRLVRAPYFLVTLDQAFLSLASTSASLVAFSIFPENELAHFVSCWTLLWGFVAILSETIVTPLRAEFNSSEHSNKSKLKITGVRTGFIYLGLFLLLVSLLALENQFISSVAASLSLAFGVTSYSLRRNTHIDLNRNLKSMSEAALLLLFFIVLISVFNFSRSLHTVDVIISITCAYYILQINGLLNVRSTRYFLGDALEVFVRNLKFGLSTVLRILLYTVAIISILRSSFAPDKIVGYGLILSLSNPGIILSSMVTQLEFKKLASLKFSTMNSAVATELLGRLTALTILGTSAGAILASILSHFSENYRSTIEVFGLYKILIYSFLCIFFIGLSGVLSNFVQILGKGNLQMLAISIGGSIGILATWFLNPMFSVFSSYAGYVLVTVLFIVRKG
jgi:hypothetical protein